MDGTNLFTRHADSVLCCAIDSRSRLAVSGGIDDTAFVWDLDTKHVIFECVGHKESVTAASFNLNSSYVATGDLNGYIQVRNTTTGIMIFNSDIDEINWILWHNKSEYVLLAGTTKGDFWMWNVNDQSAVKIFNSHGPATTCARLMEDGLSIVVGYQDGSLRIFDLKTSRTLHKLTEPGCAEIISMDVDLNKSLLVVGGIDSSVRLFTLGNLRLIVAVHCKTPKKPAIETGEASSSKEQVDETMDDQTEIKPDEVEVIDEYTNPDAKVENIIQGDGDDDEGEDDEFYDEDGTSADDNSVESVLFSPCGSYLAAANNSGTITIWDVASQVMRCEKHTGIGITRSAWTSDLQYITGCLDGNIRIYNINLNEVRQIAAHNDQILDIAHRDRILVTASEDKTCRVTKL